MNSKKKLYGSAALLSLLLLVGCSADEDTATNDSSAVGSSEMIESSSEQDESMMEDSAEGDMEESELLETPYLWCSWRLGGQQSDDGRDVHVRHPR